MELIEKATNYAEGKANEAITNAIAKAYADGYRDGYKDREEEISVDQRDGKTEYVDLGLPSGTLWAKEFETEDKVYAYLPYIKAKHLQLPTEEQCQELIETCKWHGEYSSSGHSFYGVTCIGPNGNSIKFSSIGHKEDKIKLQHVLFWLKDEQDKNDKKAMNINAGQYRKPEKKIELIYSGYKLPIRLVKTK